LQQVASRNLDIRAKTLLTGKQSSAKSHFVKLTETARNIYLRTAALRQ
jgi:hypothetical protein